MKHVLKSRFMLGTGRHDRMIRLLDGDDNFLNCYSEETFESMIPDSGDEVIFTNEYGTFVGSVSHVKYLSYNLEVNVVLENVRKLEDEESK